ncbi:MAG: hypothetical protein J0L75_15640 [Spirochaetes bacterium]|nr:hypothetical protein [Spirochaetota bacterium]
MIRKLLFLAWALLPLISCGPGATGEREPNDDRREAQNFPAKGLVHGSVKGGGSDLDVYRIAVKEPQRLELSIDMPSGQWDQLRFLTLEGGALKRFSGSAAPRGHFEFQVWCPPGSYFLEFSGTSRKEWPYVLRMDRRPDGSFEREPNDTPEQATEAEANLKIGGYYFPRDEDWYHFRSRSPEAQHLHLDLSEVAGVDAFLEVFDSKVEGLMHIDNGGPGESESVRRLLFDSNGLYVKVHSKGGAVFQNRPYTLFAEAVALDPSWESEPNAVAASANPWPENRDEMFGTIGWRGDVDWFYIPLPPGREGPLHLVLAPSQSLSLALSLEREDGSFLDVVRDLPPGGVLEWTETMNQSLAGQGGIRVCIKAAGRAFDAVHRYSLKRSFRAKKSA